MDSKFIGDVKCTYSGDAKVSSTGKAYKLCNFMATDPMYVEFKGALIFADKDGNLPDIRVGNTYRIEQGRYYSAKDSKEKSYFKFV